MRTDFEIKENEVNVVISFMETNGGGRGILSPGEDQGYDCATYWSQGSRGHDGLTFSDEEREDWRSSLEDMMGDAERDDWRRSLDDMVSEGWRVVSNGSAPAR